VNLLSILADLLYPPKCPFCGKILDARAPGLCPACQADLPRTAPGELRRTDGCGICAAPLWYRDKVPDGVRRYKFYGGQNHAALFSSLMYECVRERLPGPAELVTWTPLSKKRLRQRGYDQARLLAEGVAERLGLPAAPLLEKFRDTPPQSRLEDPEQRRANVAGAYRLLPEARERCVGLRVLLVDDVLTTGATMGECARLLQKAGAASVSALTLAWARN